MILPRVIKTLFFSLLFFETIFASNVSVVADRFEANGAFGSADSIYRTFEKNGALDRIDYLKWMKVSSVLGSYDIEAKILGLLYKKYHNLYISMRNRFVSDINSIESDNEKIKYVNTLKKELYASAGKNAADNEILTILKYTELYGEFSKYITECSMQFALKAELLSSVGKSLLNKNRIDLADTILRQALDYKIGHKMRENLFTLLFKVKSRKGATKEALAIFDSISNPNNIDISSAVVLNCRVGSYNKAENLLEKLPSSHMKDTLDVVIMIFRRDWSKARTVVEKFTPQRNINLRNSISLWLLRIALFSGDIQAVYSITSDISPTALEPRWKYTSEILENLLMLKKIGNNEFAIKLLGNILFYEYTGIYPEIKFSNIDSASNSILNVKLSEVELKMGKYQNIIDRISGRTNQSKAELYSMAVALSKIGKISEAESILKKIILGKEDTVVLQKARIYLLSIKCSK